VTATEEAEIGMTKVRAMGTCAPQE